MKKQILFITLMFMSLFDCFAQQPKHFKVLEKEKFIEKFLFEKHPTFNAFDFEFLLDTETKIKTDNKNDKDIKILNEGKDFYQKNNYKKAFECFEQAAKNNNQEAKYLMSLCYLCGKGIDRDIDKAFKIKKECEYPKAEFISIYFLEHENKNVSEVPLCKNYHASTREEYIIIAAKIAAYENNVLAQRYLGNYYYKTDFKTALRWFEKAAEQKDIESMYYVSTEYMYAFYLNSKNRYKGDKADKYFRYIRNCKGFKASKYLEDIECRIIHYHRFSSLALD